MNLNTIATWFSQHTDMAWNRTHDGWLDHAFGVCRHTLKGLVLSVAVGCLLCTGPTPPSIARVLLSLVTGSALGVGLVVTMRWTSRRGYPVGVDLAIYSALLWAIGLGVWFGAGELPTESGGGIYRHVILVLVAVLDVTLLVGIGLATRLRRKFEPGEFAPELSRTELFTDPGDVPAFSGGLFGWGVVVALVETPLQLVTPAALAVLLTPATYFQIGSGALPLNRVIGGGVLILFWIVLASRQFSERLSKVVNIAEGALFKGTAGLVSLSAVVLAAARVLNFDYVTTLLDGAGWRTFPTLAFTAYVTSWWYDYWSNRLTSQKLLELLGPVKKGTARIAYEIAEASRLKTVGAEGRRLQPHGAGRFLVIGTGKKLDDTTCFHGTYDVFQRLRPAIAGSDRATALRTCERTAKAYVYGVWLIPVVVLAVIAWRTNVGEQKAQVIASVGPITATDCPPSRKLDPPRTPASFLFEEGSCSAEPIIILAASGGGTRAAVYTASVLEDLQAIGQLKNVRLVSGISGGGVALAYFASRRRELVAGGAGDDAWQRYFDAMTKGYIADVLNALGEWRVVTGTRFGTVLAESFSRTWAAGMTLGTLDNVGLILNSTIAGHFDRAEACRDVRDGSCTGPLQQVEPRYRRRTQIRGGRLIYTNLAVPDNFQNVHLTQAEPDDPGLNKDVRLQVKVVNDPRACLANTAAANANFPPVFPDAAIDIGETERYWVTDGGVLDNRAMEVLLFAVRHALDDTRTRCSIPRPIHMIVADASALSEKFTQDRAVGTVVSAGTSFASGLVTELVQDVRHWYPQFSFHYLPMPNVIRRSGAFGTHWMLPRSIAFVPPHGTDTQVSLPGPVTVDIIRALYPSPPLASLPPAGAEKVLEWSRNGDDRYADRWTRITTALGR